MQIKKKEIEFQKQKQITIFRGDKNGDYKKHEAGAGSKSNEHAVQFAVSGRYKKCVQIFIFRFTKLVSALRKCYILS